jgi:hypothetical protein
MSEVTVLDLWVKGVGPLGCFDKLTDRADGQAGFVVRRLNVHGDEARAPRLNQRLAVLTITPLRDGRLGKPRRRFGRVQGTVTERRDGDDGPGIFGVIVKAR